MSDKLLVSSTDGEVMEEVGRRLEALRESRGMTQTEAASLSGLARRTVYSAERGENPSLLTLVRLLRSYGALGALESFIPETEISPMEIVSARKKGKGRNG